LDTLHTVGIEPTPLSRIAYRCRRNLKLSP